MSYKVFLYNIPKVSAVALSPSSQAGFLPPSPLGTDREVG
jgi:hypothetical protein